MGSFQLMSGLDNANRDHWQSKANQVARTVNFAWWLETLAAPLLVGLHRCSADIYVYDNWFLERRPTDRSVCLTN